MQTKKQELFELASAWMREDQIWVYFEPEAGESQWDPTKAGNTPKD